MSRTPRHGPFAANTRRSLCWHSRASSILSALGVAPILALSIIAVAVVLLTRCIDADEAFSFVEGQLLALIFAMLAIGAALESSGAVELIVGALVPYLEGLQGPLIVWAVFLMTSLLTEMVSNNAVAVVVTPIAISLGEALGIDPRALVVAVMVAASCSFRDAHRLSDQHARLRPRGLPVQRLSEGGDSSQHQCRRDLRAADPADLAALTSGVRRTRAQTI